MSNTAISVLALKSRELIEFKEKETAAAIDKYNDAHGALNNEYKQGTEEFQTEFSDVRTANASELAGMRSAISEKFNALVAYHYDNSEGIIDSTAEAVKEIKDDEKRITDAIDKYDQDHKDAIANFNTAFGNFDEDFNMETEYDFSPVPPFSPEA